MLSLYPSQCFKKIERQLSGTGLTEDLILSPEEQEQKRGSWENSTQKNKRKVINYLGILKSSNMKKRSWVGGHATVIPVLRKQRQEDLKFGASLGYRVRSWPARDRV